MSAIETLGQEAGQVAKAAAAPAHAGAAKDAAEKGNNGAAASHLALMIGEDRYLVELAEAGEIVPMPSTSIMQVPLTQDWFLGVVNVRGALFPRHSPTFFSLKHPRRIAPGLQSTPLQPLV